MNQWPPPETQDLLYKHEEFIAAINQIRAREEAERRPNSWLQRLFETSGGAALITVMIGGVCCGILNFLIQRDLGARESQQALLRSQFEQKLIAYKNLEDRRQEFLKRLYEQVGKSTTAAYDLMSLTWEEIPLTDNEDYLAEVKKQREEKRQKYNTSDLEWRTEQVSTELLVNYYHNNAPDIKNAWQQARDAVNNYMKCAELTWGKYNESKVTNTLDSICLTEHQAFKEKLGEFTIKVGNLRQPIFGEDAMAK